MCTTLKNLFAILWLEGSRKPLLDPKRYELKLAALEYLKMLKK